MAQQSKFTQRGFQLTGISAAILIGAFLKQKLASQRRDSLRISVDKSRASNARNKEKIVVNSNFFKKLGLLLKIMVPSVFFP